MVNQEDVILIEKIFVYVVGVAGGVVNVLGLVGNSLSLTVLLRQEMRSSNPNLYPIMLGVYDILFLFLDLFQSSLDWIMYGIDPETLFNLEFTVPASVVLNPIIMVMITGSVYTTVCMTLDRCIAVLKPLHWASLSTRFRIKIILCLVFVCSVLYNGPFFAEFTFKKVHFKDLNQDFWLSVQTDYSYSYFHTKIFLLYIVPAVSLVIPMAVIFIANTLIISKTSFSRRKIGNQQSSLRMKDANRLTLQVVLISLITLFSRVLQACTYILMTQQNTVYVTRCSVGCATVAAVSAFFLKVNSAVNFIFYCCCGEKFRNVFKRKYPCFKRACSASFRSWSQRGVAQGQRRGTGSLNESVTASQDSRKSSVQTISSFISNNSPEVTSSQPKGGNSNQVTAITSIL